MSHLISSVGISAVHPDKLTCKWQEVSPHLPPVHLKKKKNSLMHILIQATFYRKFARARVQEKQQVEMPLSHLNVCLGLQRTPERTTAYFHYGANWNHRKVT